MLRAVDSTAAGYRNGPPMVTLGTHTCPMRPMHKTLSLLDAIRCFMILTRPEKASTINSTQSCCYIHLGYPCRTANLLVRLAGFDPFNYAQVRVATHGFQAVPSDRVSVAARLACILRHQHTLTFSQSPKIVTYTIENIERPILRQLELRQTNMRHCTNLYS